MHRSSLFALCLAAAAGPLSAQVPADTLPPPAAAIDTLPPDTVPRESRVPRNAFLKALILPGWGHYSVGATTRGMFFTVTQGASWYMLVKTLRRLSRAEDRDDELTGLATDSLSALIASDTAIARELSDPDAYELALLGYPGLSDARGLVGAREQQRQDWIAYTVALTLAAGIDAYVAAHLRTFPGDITTVPEPDGGVSLRFSLPVGPPGRRP
ncbi:MAG TPA: hypothetical protein VK939_15530 [Longimicrobiales bacterium]|nr:hypothetical protein [Longimicrobiales bacterium]